MLAFEAAGILIGVAIRNNLPQRQPADWMIEYDDEDYAPMEDQLRKNAEDLDDGWGLLAHPGMCRAPVHGRARVGGAEVGRDTRPAIEAGRPARVTCIMGGQRCG